MMKKILWGAVAATVAAMLIACGSTPAENGKPLGGAATVSPKVAASYFQPVAESFQVTVKVVRRKCFGSAGCNVTFKIELSQVRGGTLDPDVTYELTYEVRGGKDPFTDTITVLGSHYEIPDEELIQTSGPNKQLTAVVMSVTAL